MKKKSAFGLLKGSSLTKALIELREEEKKDEKKHDRMLMKLMPKKPRKRN